MIPSAIKGLETCPILNECRLTNPAAAPCGTVPSHFQQLAVAEELCPKILPGAVAAEQATYRRLSSIDAPSDLIETEHHLAMAWLRTEGALNPKLPSDWAEEYFQDAELYANRVLETSVSTFELKLSAANLQLALPAFRGRRPENPDLSDEGWQRIVLERAMLVKPMLAAEMHSQKTHPGHLTQEDHKACFGDASRRQAVIAQHGATLLCGLAGVRLYPASMREANDHTNNTKHGHDGYELLDPSTKLPIKTLYTGSRHHRSTILFLPFGNLSKIAYQHTTPENVIEDFEPGTVIPAETTVELISRFALGETLLAGEEKYVTNMQKAVARRVKKHRRQFDGPEADRQI